MSEPEYEVRFFYSLEPLIKNPAEYYRHTRSYEEMREEYEFLNCGKITIEDIGEALIEIAKWRHNGL